MSFLYNSLLKASLNILAYFSSKNILYCIILYYIILYYIIFYYIILCYIILYHILLYYIIFYYIILYFIILYYIILYYLTLSYILIYIWYSFFEIDGLICKTFFELPLKAPIASGLDTFQPMWDMIYSRHPLSRMRFISNFRYVEQIIGSLEGSR